MDPSGTLQATKFWRRTAVFPTHVSNGNLIDRGWRPPKLSDPMTATAPTRFGTAPDGSDVTLVTLRHAGTTVRLMTYGASLQDFRLDGVDHALVLGSPEFDAYLTKMRYFGAVVGPIANRIANGKAPLQGQMLDFERNENDSTMLHGGTQGTGQQNWQLTSFDSRSCVMLLQFGDGTGGLPGPVALTARYSLDDAGALVLQLEGKSEVPSFCNLAHHGYWNLDDSGSLAEHKLTVLAETYLPVDAALIPLGAPMAVADTRFDFRSPHSITGPDTDTGTVKALLDHNFCLNNRSGEPALACTLQSGQLRLDISTTEPGLQVYDGTGMDTAPFVGHAGRAYGCHGGVAIEPQHWPDSPNQPSYPSILLMPGETYSQMSRFHAYKVAD